MIKFFTEAFERFTTGVPSFFKKLQAFGAFLTLLGGQILAIPFTTPHLEFLNKFGPELLEGGILIAFICQFVVKANPTSTITAVKPVLPEDNK